ncbi:M20 family peptidase [Natronogracilivirgula saccharolytica]|uniref:M20 family peptidase n=1 Tax=Natronogracilivirga saccharolytica TaxID=2812953 RepID=A0A8J7UWR3_9BACT|nr:M20 family peptidase [Natronogracilivirga saccharolytica]
MIRTFRYSRVDVDTSANIPSRINVETAAQRLGKAISYQTVSTQSSKDFNESEFLNMHQYLENAFPLIHASLKKEIINDYSLLYFWEGKDPELKPVMLTCHLDVVPIEPGTENEWKYPPFEGKVSEGYIWGRGAMDVQGGVLAIMEAVEYLLSKEFRPDRTIILGFGHDEEIDGERGAQAIGETLAQRGIELACLLDEGTPIVHDVLAELPNPVALVAVAEKGYLSLELSTSAEGGHSSVPQGLTAIARLSEAIQKLEKNPMNNKVDGLVKQTMTAIGPQMPFLYRIVMANLWLFGGLVKKELAAMPATRAALGTTIATTIFESGIKENVLPTQAKAIVNFRIHPNDTIESVIDHVRRTINDPEVRISELPGSINPSQISDVAASPYKTLKKTIREVFPDVIVAPTLMIGATDARHYAHLTDNIYRFLPLRADEGDLDRVHGTNERLSKENYREMIEFYIRLIEESAD